MNEIKVVGITGGVGSGKSVVMNYLKDQYGAEIILADLVAHELMEPGKKSYEEILDYFGTEILNEDETIDRRILGSIVFNDPAALSQLNRITHPNVKEEILDRICRIREEGRAPFIALEAALLIEEDYVRYLDELWYISVDETLRKQRLKEGRGYTEEKSEQIMASQLSSDIYLKEANRIIDNRGSLEQLKKETDKAVKAMFRKHLLKKREEMTPEERTEQTRSAYQTLTQWEHYKKEKLIYLFVSFGTEIDTVSMIDKMLRDGKTVAVPRIHGNELVFHQIEGTKDLEPGPYYGIPEPGPGCKEVDEKGLMLLPGLGFDPAGRRIGYGGGYYDRYLDKHTDVIKAGLGYECQFVRYIPAASHDIALDYLILPTKIVSVEH